MPNLLLRYAAVIVLASAGQVCGATDSVCPTPMHDKYTWWIPESAFTAERAQEEMGRLQEMLAPGVVGVDATSWETSFLYIEGWLLRRDALEGIKRGERDPYVKDFCDFMRTKAHVRH